MDDQPSQRSRRTRTDKASKFEKLKQLKGNKNKYELTDIDNVYEEVDEKAYSKKVLERQDDDWIVDDDGGGYVEDGREIFDDDLADDSIDSVSKRKNKESKGVKRGRISNKLCDQADGKGSNIRAMLINMPNKKRKKEIVKLEDEDLGDLMQELHSKSSYSPASSKGTPHPSVNPKANELSPKSYLKSLTANTPVKNKTNFKKITPRNLVEVVKENEENELALFNEVSSFDVQENIKTEVEDIFHSDDEFPDAAALEAAEVENCKQTMIDGLNSSEIKKEMTADLVSSNAVLIKSSPLVKEEDKSNVWETMAGSGCQNLITASDVKIDNAVLPLIRKEDGKKVLRFYWWDAYEEPFKQPGIVYLFGKVYIESVKKHVSCCVIVKNIERTVYLLPREEHFDMEHKASTGKEVLFNEVYEEFNKKVAEKYKILTFKCRKVTKENCFGASNIPLSSEYLEIKYSADCAALPSNLQGETFSHVFGTKTNSLELLLLGRKIKGPCWLEIENPQPVNNQMSWCKIEAVTVKPEYVSVYSENQATPPPPLVVATLNLRTLMNSKTSQNEIVMLSCLIHDSFCVDKAPPRPLFQQHFCAFTRPSDVPFPYDIKDASARYKGTKLERMESERALLGFFLAKLFKLDPDLIVGHDLHGFGLDILVQRITVNKVPQWSRLGRLRRANVPIKGKGQAERNVMCGRLVCDIKISAKELIRSRSYDLGTLCDNVLRLKENERKELTMVELRAMFQSSTKLMELVNCTMQDTAYIIRLMCELNVLPLALQITNIAGNVMSRTLLGGRSERNEFLLLHAFTEKNYIVPDKEYNKKLNIDENDLEEQPSIGEKNTTINTSKGRKKPSYAGGLVLEPKKGFYDTLILLMDFNSLYPSIIQEYNICFTTIHHRASSAPVNEEVIPDLPDPNLSPGILPTEIRKLVESRRAVKNLLSAQNLSPEQKLQYNIRQMALKLTANSMYGCLGFSHSRFYAKPLAALVTAKGREILMNTKELVEKSQYEVIYGDTDSIMINTNCMEYDQVFKIGHKIKQDVNRLYKQVELDIDGVFKYMLLLKKKKYAAVTISRSPTGELVMKQEHKGLDIVRRDWSQLSAEAGRYVLDQILSDQTLDEKIENIHCHLTKIQQDLEAGKVPLQLLAITKQLTKSVDEYTDKKALPHVQVAARLNSNGEKKLRSGDTVSYIICEDGTDLPATQRAYHIDELKTKENLKVDIKYYLSQQIHPVVCRLCDPIEGTDAARIAECLGLDPSGYRKSANHQYIDHKNLDGEQIILSDAEKYKHCEKFSFTCMNDMCKQENFIEGPFRKTESGSQVVLQQCCNPECKVSPLQYLPSIENRLILDVRKHVEKYYENWLVCEDPGCPNITRRVPLVFSYGYPVCSLCQKGLMYKKYSDRDLHLQINYYQHIFDFAKYPKPKECSRTSPEVEAGFMKLSRLAKGVISVSAYNFVDLSKIFETLQNEVTASSTKNIPCIKEEKYV